MKAAQVRQNFAETLRRSHDDPVAIERRGKLVAVLVGADQFEQMRQAMEDLEDIAAFDAAMAEEGPNLPWQQAKADLGWA
ncbi:MAG: type II toxin-antitoxin system Phd/YefM family antitoxin [Bifidobacteriaceae bacterium]|jgi:prevent-host-death family protein|nr:type II toxin-antitoxin system Phd/YefM family antitoxin [Bifidobacteriaceae bacterium]